MPVFLYEAISDREASCWLHPYYMGIRFLSLINAKCSRVRSYNQHPACFILADLNDGISHTFKRYCPLLRAFYIQAVNWQESKELEQGGGFNIIFREVDWQGACYITRVPVHSQIRRTHVNGTDVADVRLDK